MWVRSLPVRAVNGIQYGRTVLGMLGPMASQQQVFVRFQKTVETFRLGLKGTGRDKKIDRLRRFPFFACVDYLRSVSWALWFGVGASMAFLEHKSSL